MKLGKIPTSKMNAEESIPPRYMCACSLTQLNLIAWGSTVSDSCISSFEF